MKTKADVIVVGAGIWGASAAFFLATEGHNVTLIEKEHPASGPTGRSSAVMHAFYPMTEMAMLAARGMEIFQYFPEITGGPKVHHPIGTLWGCRRDHHDQVRQIVDEIAGRGVRMEIRHGEKLYGMAPGFNWDGIEFAVWEPDAGYADPYDSTNALVTRARELGAKVRLNSRVDDILVEAGRATGVVLDNGETLRADSVIVAMGIWTRPLLENLGVNLPLTRLRAPHVLLDAPQNAREILPFAWVDDVLENYCRPEGASTIILSENNITVKDLSNGFTEPDGTYSTTESDPDNYNNGCETEETIAIMESFVPRIPQLLDLGVRPGYSCLLDYTPDMNPIIDAVPGAEGLFIACGSSGHGFKSGPAIGEAAAQMALGNKPAHLAPFNIHRFLGA